MKSNYLHQNDDSKIDPTIVSMDIDHKSHLYPFCIVWTPIPLLTWIFPFAGHMGIATSKGIIQDFSGSYSINKDQMAFGWPIRYWQLDPYRLPGGIGAWDRAVEESSNEYVKRMHNLILDNCHSHVAMALNRMEYENRSNLNMVNLTIYVFFRGRYTGIHGLVKHWMPSLIIFMIFIMIAFL